MESGLLNRSSRGSQLGLVIIATLLAAVGSAVLWGIVTKATKHELGIAAVVVGLIVGAVVARVGSGLERTQLQVIAAIGALLGIGLGKYLAIVWINSNPLFSSPAWNLLTSSRAWDLFDVLFAVFAVVQAVRIASGGTFYGRSLGRTPSRPVLLHGPGTMSTTPMSTTPMSTTPLSTTPILTTPPPPPVAPPIVEPTVTDPTAPSDPPH